MILAGVKSVTVHDTHDTQLRDLAAQFYLSKTDIGRNRAEACRERLQELNTAVNVTASSAELTQDFLSHFQVRSLRMHVARLRMLSTFFFSPFTATCAYSDCACTQRALS